MKSSSLALIAAFLVSSVTAHGGVTSYVIGGRHLYLFQSNGCSIYNNRHDLPWLAAIQLAHWPELH